MTRQSINGDGNCMGKRIRVSRNRNKVVKEKFGERASFGEQ